MTRCAALCSPKPFLTFTSTRWLGLLVAQYAPLTQPPFTTPTRLVHQHCCAVQGLADSASFHDTLTLHQVGVPALLCCAGIGTRSIYSVGRLQAFARSEEGRRSRLSGLKQLERDWVQHQRQIPATNFIWGWPQRWYRRGNRRAQ